MLLTSFHQSFGQTQSGKVTYKVIPPQSISQYVDTSGFDKSGKKIIMKMYQGIVRAAPSLSYTLTFNTTESIFKYNRQMRSDNGINPNRVAKRIASFGTYYTNIPEKLKLLQFTLPDKTWRVKTALQELDWTIHSSSKRINGYPCKKATALYVLNGLKPITLTAWFCPSLPFQFGPLEASGLPGLVLELERNHYHYYATDINLEASSKSIKKPNQGELVSPAVYLREKTRYFQRRRNSYK